LEGPLVRSIDNGESAFFNTAIITEVLGQKAISGKF